jgi:hypothetical protein
MLNRLFGGNGSSQGTTNVVKLGPGWAVAFANPGHPPPADDLPYALSQGLERWLKELPGIRVRAALPIVRGGNAIGIHVWYDGDGGTASGG